MTITAARYDRAIVEGPLFPAVWKIAWPTMGEYLVRDEGIWWSVNGSQENTLEREGGDCVQERATFDWAEFRCEAIQLHFRFTMTVQRFEVLPMEGWNPRDSVVPAPAPESKVITMVRTVTLVIAKGAGSGLSVARNRAPLAAARSRAVVVSIMTSQGEPGRAVQGAPAAGGFPTGLWLEECRCHSSRWNADSGLNLMLVPVVA